MLKNGVLGRSGGVEYNWSVKNKQKMLDYQKEIGKIQQIIRSA